MVDKCSSYSKTTLFETFGSELSAIGNDDRMLRSKLFVVCKCPGGRDTFYYQMSGPWGSSYIKCSRGGCSRLELTRTLFSAFLLARIYLDNGIF